MEKNQMQQLQQLQQQMQEIQEYLETLEETQEEVSRSREAVKNIEDAEPGTEILAPLGSGAYVVAEIKETNEVISEVGGDTFEKRSNDEAAKVFKKQEELIEETSDDLEGRLQQMQQQMQQLQQQAQQQQNQPE
ncbi:MAG: prefoldin subunit alpha [Candidatus Nanohaloarchaea archaeon]